MADRFCRDPLRRRALDGHKAIRRNPHGFCCHGSERVAISRANVDLLTSQPTSLAQAYDSHRWVIDQRHFLPNRGGTVIREFSSAIKGFMRLGISRPDRRGAVPRQPNLPNTRPHRTYRSSADCRDRTCPPGSQSVPGTRLETIGISWHWASNGHPCMAPYKRGDVDGRHVGGTPVGHLPGRDVG